MCCYIGGWVRDVLLYWGWVRDVLLYWGWVRGVLLYWGVGKECVAILEGGLGMCCYIGGG